jgi:hypothetical protein
MKLKDILKALQEIYKEYGDIEVFTDCYNGSIDNIRVDQSSDDENDKPYIILEG